MRPENFSNNFRIPGIESTWNDVGGTSQFLGIDRGIIAGAGHSVTVTVTTLAPQRKKHTISRSSPLNEGEDKVTV
jgi:hypothetical protein